MEVLEYHADNFRVHSVSFRKLQKSTKEESAMTHFVLWEAGSQI